MKITLPDGTLIEPDGPEELRFVLKELALGRAAGVPSGEPIGATTAADTKVDVGRWSKADVNALYLKLAEGSRRLLKLLANRGDLNTSEIAKAFGYEDARPIGGLLNGIRANARLLHMESPIDSTEVNGERRITLHPEFRSAATGGRAPEIS